MAGRGNDNKKRKTAGGDRKDPPGKRPTGSNPDGKWYKAAPGLPLVVTTTRTSDQSSRPPPPAASDMREKLDRAKEAQARAAEAKKKKSGIAAAEIVGSSSVAQVLASVGSSQADQRSQTKPAGTLTAPPKPKMIVHKATVNPSPELKKTGKDVVVAEKGGSSSAKEPAAAPGMALALIEQTPALDKAKEVATDADHPPLGGDDESGLPENNLFASSSATGNFLEYRYQGPRLLHNHGEACAELLYSIRGFPETPYPDLEHLEWREEYGRVARPIVKGLAMLNEMVACYDSELFKVREGAKKVDEIAAELAKEKEKSARLRAELAAKDKQLAAKDEQNRRLKNRLRYLKEVEKPSRWFVQVRGTLGIMKDLKEKAKIDIPQKYMDRFESDLKKYEDQVKEIPEVKIDDEDLL